MKTPISFKVLLFLTVQPVVAVAETNSPNRRRKGDLNEQDRRDSDENTECAGLLHQSTSLEHYAMNRRRALPAILTPILALATTKNVVAQKKNGGGGGKGGGGGGKNGNDKKDKTNEVHFSGKIKQVSTQGIVVDSDDSRHYLIGLEPTSEVVVEGQASKDFLVPGASVEFDIDLNRDGKSNQEVQAITIVELSTLNPAGLFPTTIPAANGKPDSEAAKPYLARGRVVTFKDNALTLQTGSKSIAVKVSGKVSLDARISNWRFASIGDSIKGSGELPPQANLGLMRVVAKRLNIKASATIEPKGSKRTNDKS